MCTVMMGVSISQAFASSLHPLQQRWSQRAHAHLAEGAHEAFLVLAGLRMAALHSLSHAPDMLYDGLLQGTRGQALVQLADGSLQGAGCLQHVAFRMQCIALRSSGVCLGGLSGVCVDQGLC